MNSEELEQSLRAEFENYLKQVVAGMREDVTEFQIKIETEFEKHKSHIDEAFKGFSARFDSEAAFDEAFRESVVEHLRLARDEGAKITATAIAEAEEMERLSTPEFNLSDIKEAVNDISSKDSQSAILKSLIQHAATYTPRGAFFIIKNDHFVGWKVFGKEAGDGETAVRDIHFPVSADSILGRSVRDQSIAEGSFGTYSEDGSFLEPLEFGQPDRMYAIPLVARGRGVAVLYADYGHEGVAVNTDALEMLVRVAGLTVEMLASAKAARYGADTASTEDLHEDSSMSESLHHEGSFDSATPVASSISGSFDAQYGHAESKMESLQPDAASSPFGYDVEPYRPVEKVDTPFVETTESELENVSHESPFEPVADFSAGVEPVFETPAAENTEAVEIEASEYPAAEHVHFESYSAVTETYTEYSDGSPIEAESAVEHPVEAENVDDTHAFAFSESSADHSAVDETQAVSGSVEPDAVEEVEASSEAVTAEFDTKSVAEPVVSFNDVSPFDKPVEKFEPAATIGGMAPVNLTPVVEKVTVPTGSRLSDRNVDLPIEVADDERRLHNDARRFARLLVSEIKLYNEKKVQEGREANDLYERLREAIDRSREMYDKRVQPPVASKFDYFHYELVNSLAEGDIGRLGGSYPGATV